MDEKVDDESLCGKAQDWNAASLAGDAEIILFKPRRDVRMKFSVRGAVGLGGLG